MELITKMFYVLTSLIFNHGYTGLGSRMDDICGRDWVAGAGDHGDPGLILFMMMFQAPL
jgi:cytochrome b